MATPTVAADLKHLLGTAADHDRLDVNIFLRGAPTDVVPKSAVADATDALSATDVVDRLKSAAESARPGCSPS
jgi:hypothetical protein